MTTYKPPNENLPIFDPLQFQTADINLTQAIADTRYLRFPNAQGTENLGAINVNGASIFNSTVAFNDTTLPTSAGVLPAPNTISTQIPTMDWVQQAITAGGVNILANNNTWTGQNTFTISSYATYSIPQFSNDTTIANTQWTTSLIAYYYNIILGAGVASPLQTSLIYGRTPYTFDLQFATFNPAFAFNPSQVSFASSVINNTFAYSTNTTFFWNSEPQKPASAANFQSISYFNPAITNFNSVQLSGDGNYALICNDGLGTNPSDVYSWKNGIGGIATTTIPNGFWWDSALSLTGQYQIVCGADGTKGLYVSNDYGVSWNETSPVGVFTSVAVSASGKYMVGLDQNNGIYVSNDFGATFPSTPILIPNDWCNVCMSATGQYILAVPNFNAGTPNNSYLSTDFGVSFNDLTTFGVPSLMTITNCCMSDDGLMMVIFVGAVAYQSFNYGASWTSVPNVLSFRMMTGTQNGAKARFAQRNKYLLGWTAGGMPYYAEFSSNW